MDSDLVLYSKIENAITTATKIDEISEIRKKLAAIAEYRKHNYPDHFKTLILTIKAALKHIEIYDALEDKRPEGMPGHSTSNDRYQYIGWQEAGFLHQQEPKKLRKIRQNIHDEDLREYFEDRRIGNKYPSFESLLSLVKEILIEEDKSNDPIPGLDIRKGDFKEVLKDVFNIDAIITDPPYPKEFIQCFSDLSLFAKDHLKDDGFCVVYSGQYHLPEVIQRLSENLTYVWTFCLYHSGKMQLVNGVNIMCGWKPVLVFSKGKKKMRFSAYDVVISEQREKDKHKWQQSESGVKQLIEIFSKPNELIVDPFSGSGAFCKVAQELGRRSIGAEISDQEKK